MNKKPSGNYESPEVSLLRLERANDVLTKSGENYIGWDWDNGTTSGNDGNLFA